MILLMMKGIGYVLMLLHFCGATQEDIWMNWAVSIQMKDAAEFCNGVLITLSNALTTCECATNPDFVLPEFLRRTGQYLVEIRKNQEGYQSREVLKFDPHPKCTSNYFVQGFLAYNYGFVTTAAPFEGTQYVQPIEKFRLNPDGDLLFGSKCTVMGRNFDSSITPLPIDLKNDQNCSMRASQALGSDNINFEERGMACADLEMTIPCNKTTGNCENGRFGASVSIDPRQPDGQNVSDICDGLVVSGAPVLCGGVLAGLVGHGLCKWNSAPVIISRIELTNRFIGFFSDGERSARNQVLLEISSTVLILMNL